MTVVLLIVIELLFGRQVAVVDLALFAVSLSLAVVEIGLSVMLLLKLVFAVCDMLMERGTLVLDLDMTVDGGAAETVTFDFADTVTGVTVTDELSIVGE